MPPKNFTVVRGTDVRIEIPLLRDGATQRFGFEAKVWFTIAGILSISTEGEEPEIVIPDPLDNKAIVTIARGLLADVEEGKYAAECIVQLADDNEQCVWKGCFSFPDRLTAATA